MYEQREAKGAEHFEPQGPWVPSDLEAIPDDAKERLTHGPWYAVIDEIHGASCRFTIDVWPEVDADGRLLFDIDRTTLQWVDRDTAYDVIRRAREESATTAEERQVAVRALRIGDVFAIWPDAARRLELTPPSGVADADREEAGGPAGGIVDVTRPARIATRAAADAVGSGDLVEGDLDRLGITDSAVRRGQTA